MALKITPEIRQALIDQPGEPVFVEDDETQNVYVLVDQQTHEKAMQALREKRDIDSIQCGIEQMEAGQGRPIAEADAAMRRELGSRHIHERSSRHSAGSRGKHRPIG